jgi:hypothetical protein
VTMLDAMADQVRAGAANVRPPKVSSILVVLVALVPFVLGWSANTLWQGVRIVKAAFLHGWSVGEAKMGPERKPTGGS